MCYSFTDFSPKEHCTAVRKVLLDWAQADDNTCTMDKTRNTLLKLFGSDIDICFVNV
jgi:hypothetical protein